MKIIYKLLHCLGISCKLAVQGKVFEWKWSFGEIVYSTIYDKGLASNKGKYISLL